MYLIRLKLSSTLFNEIIQDQAYYVDEVEDLAPYLLGYDDKKRIKYCPKDNTMIIELAKLQYFAKEKLTNDNWRQALCYCSDEVQSFDYESLPYLTQARKYINTILLKYYTEEEIKQCYKDHELHEHVKPKHVYLPEFYKDNKILEFHNCVYYDINNAHLDALVEIFPKAKQGLINIRTQINRYKTVGTKEALKKAQDLKYMVNIFCGGLGRALNKERTVFEETRPTYEWIVNRTREILQGCIDECKGERGTILYANTDGVIIRNPSKELITSNKLGHFKSEIIDDTIYALRYVPIGENKTPYLIYQYTDTKGKQVIKGNMPLSIRDKVDLSKGRAVKYKVRKENEKYLIENIVLYNEEIELWR